MSQGPFPAADPESAFPLDPELFYPELLDPEPELEPPLDPELLDPELEPELDPEPEPEVEPELPLKAEPPESPLEPEPAPVMEAPDPLRAPDALASEVSLAELSPPEPQA
jgi:hypothetical protein